ncbi:FRG domain-containing protein [Psychroflexus torquis]|nr:FRG domain-containing protein [Psychroflexus torquis]
MDNTYIIRKEKSLIDELKRRGDKLTQSGNLNDWELLVYAQHFGLATQLLDWSTNPLVSLWFACNESKESTGYVYILKQSDENMLDVHKNHSPYEISSSKIFRPILNNERIIAQNGWFTAHSLNDNKFKKLDSEKEFGNKISLIEIPASEKLTMLLKLDILGMNNKTIYPEIEGTCRHIN